MPFYIEPLDQSNAEKIASWHYEGEYSFYDFEADPDDLAELFDPVLRGESMFAVRDSTGELVGFFAYQHKDEGECLRPQSRLARGVM